jgi:hypothetical protein
VIVVVKIAIEASVAVIALEIAGTVVVIAIAETVQTREIVEIVLVTEIPYARPEIAWHAFASVTALHRALVVPVLRGTERRLVVDSLCSKVLHAWYLLKPVT